MNYIAKTLLVAAGFVLFGLVAYDVVAARGGEKNWVYQFLPKPSSEVIAEQDKQAKILLAQRFSDVDADAKQKLDEVERAKDAFKEKLSAEQKRFADARQAEQLAAAKDEPRDLTNEVPYISADEAKYMGGNKGGDELGSYLNSAGLSDASLGGLSMDSISGMMGGLGL